MLPFWTLLGCGAATFGDDTGTRPSRDTGEDTGGDTGDTVDTRPTEPTDTASCFEAGTRVAIPGGEMAIEALRPGDEVLSLDVDSGEVVVRRVVHLRPGLACRVARLQVGDRVIAGVTAEHPFYDPEQRRWIKAGDLRPGQVLVGLHGRVSRPITLDAIDWRDEQVEVYDLSLEGPEHDFFAEGVLVHNKSYEDWAYWTFTVTFGVSGGEIGPFQISIDDVQPPTLQALFFEEEDIDDPPIEPGCTIAAEIHPRAPSEALPDGSLLASALQLEVFDDGCGRELYPFGDAGVALETEALALSIGDVVPEIAAAFGKDLEPYVHGVDLGLWVDEAWTWGAAGATLVYRLDEEGSVLTGSEPADYLVPVGEAWPEPCVVAASGFYLYSLSLLFD